MLFNVGDIVVHPAHGVGQIVKVEEKRFSGKEAGLYYEVMLQKSTIWVPVEAQGASSLRGLTDKRDLAQYRNVLKGRPALLDTDSHKRHLELVQRLRQGSFQVKCEVVRDLTARSWYKPLNEFDSNSLRKVREDLCQEWATAEGISLSEASTEVGALLWEAQQAYMV